MQIKLKIGKTIEANPVPSVNGPLVEVFGARGEFTRQKDGWAIWKLKGNQDLADFFGQSDLVGKEFGIRIEDESYEALHAACLMANDQLEARLEAERQAMIATRPQWTGLVFSGWYLSETPTLARLYLDTDEHTWYQAEVIRCFPEIHPKDAIDAGLKEVNLNTRFEARLFEVSDLDIDALARLSHERHEPKRLAAEAEQRQREQAKAARLAREQEVATKYDISTTRPKTFNADGDYEIKVAVTVKASGKIYQFSARNIEDFGLAINPVPGGGLAIDVEAFMAHNNFTFDTEEKKQAYRDAHPTPTGWGWDRYYSTSGPKWVPMTEEEVDVYKAVAERLRGYTEIRM